MDAEMLLDLDLADLQERDRHMTTEIIDLAERFGYGCVIDKAARAWAIKPPMKPRRMVMWLRDLADEIEKIDEARRHRRTGQQGIE